MRGRRAHGTSSMAHGLQACLGYHWRSHHHQHHHHHHHHHHHRHHHHQHHHHHHHHHHLLKDFLQLLHSREDILRI